MSSDTQRLAEIASSLPVELVIESFYYVMNLYDSGVRGDELDRKCAEYSKALKDKYSPASKPQGGGPTMS